MTNRINGVKTKLKKKRFVQQGKADSFEQKKQKGKEDKNGPPQVTF